MNDHEEVVKKLEDLKYIGIKSWKEIRELIFNIWQDLKKTYESEVEKSQLQKT